MYIYIVEAILNLKENIKYTLTFILFLSLSFLGVIITDSLIYSVSIQAEKELKSNGNNIMSIDLHTPTSADRIKKVLSKCCTELSFSQHSFLNGGKSPYSSDGLPVIAVDKKGISLIMDEKIGKKFEGNVAVYNNNKQTESINPESIFLNGLPFQIIGIKNKSKTEFLDSLGLSTNSSNEKYYIPLETLFRFNLSNEIDNVKIIMNRDVTSDMITMIEHTLNENNINRYTITTSLDAREIVDKVLNRFSILTNSIYILLTTTAIFSSITVCKRNFFSRTTEYSLKLIHGISYSSIRTILIIETIFTVAVSLLFSILISALTIISMSGLLSIDISIRWFMIIISLTIVLLTCFSANFYYSNKTFKINPIELIRLRAK
ncbi:ABC transporter permease [Escherichia coli]|uniref:FtsX-like permease family protein n=2 Tax=Escherichia coli TaxID=562 RepID=UPI000D13DA6F|nr:FtsX-like permease family protein [Escherichia coli]EEQ2265149.1 ABC transporter permease [Escherichia coli]EEQ8441291.1 ABC transporter permease [Escherichia coli]EES0864680.1 ABC transporter permease [Escherichia coli]EET1199444.1 ABC transporter permease [Escherichia coli]EET1297660.1 ABC transporter permease [Escherichia coli]